MIRKGRYILLMTVPESDLEIGSLGMLHFCGGRYCYVGSAMNGLDQRIGRHFSKDKKIRWHIDRLTIACEEIAAFESTDPELSECDLAELIIRAGGESVAKGFGCSDCKCRTHLFMLDSDAERRLCSDERLMPHCRRIERCSTAQPL